MPNFVAIRKGIDEQANRCVISWCSLNNYFNFHGCLSFFKYSIIDRPCGIKGEEVHIHNSTSYFAKALPLAFGIRRTKVLRNTYLRVWNHVGVKRKLMFLALNTLYVCNKKKLCKEKEIENEPYQNSVKEEKWGNILKNTLNRYI